MNDCKNCAWDQIKDAKMYCDMIRSAGIKCDRFMPLGNAFKKNEDGTFDCPRCKRNRDPGKCWNCGLEDED